MNIEERPLYRPNTIADEGLKPRPFLDEAALRSRPSIRRAPGGHWRDPKPQPFTQNERAHTTIWISGLTLAHDRFVRSALEGIGYRVESLPCPDNDALRVGKEFGNRGQCNPTYYT